MHNNSYWKAFLLFVLGCTLVYSGIAAYRYYEYIRLTDKQPITKVVQWDIFEKSDEEFILISTYEFTVAGRDYTGKMEWSDFPYRNEWSAKKAIQERGQEPLFVWYDPSNPNYSSLQKHFPVKQCIYAVFLWGLFLYFIWIGSYVANNRN